MAWQLKDVAANRHNDNYTVSVEYVKQGQTLITHTGQVGAAGDAAEFVREARHALRRAVQASQRKHDAESAGRFTQLLDRLNAE